MSNSNSYDVFKEGLENYPFIIIIGKYDQILGPRAIASSIASIPVKEEAFFNNLLRDALNTKNKYVILDFNKFYSQICKVDIEDTNARGEKQLYVIILLRHAQYPLIPTIHFHRIETIFHKIGNDKILADNENSFKDFFREINEIYIAKEELLPIESLNLHIRSGINTIHGFCELILEEKKKKGTISEDLVINYIEMMLESCKNIMDALEKNS